MKKLRIRILSLLLVLVWLPTLMISPLAADTVIASGECGAASDNVVWTLTSDRTLTISGSGNMADFASSISSPWQSYKDMILKVVIEEGITSIGKYAFYSCANLTQATIHNGVASIGDYAFNETGLTQINLPEGLETICYGAFYRCRRLSQITFPETLTTIDQFAFASCTELNFTELPSSLKSIKNAAFSGCWKLSLTQLPEGLTSIGESAFSECGKLALTSLPTGITKIGYATFASCTSLSQLYLHLSLIHI